MKSAGAKEPTHTPSTSAGSMPASVTAPRAASLVRSYSDCRSVISLVSRFFFTNEPNVVL